MKKVPLMVAILALIVSSVGFYFAKSSSELVYVDVNKLIEGYNRTKLVKAEFEKKTNTAKNQIDSLMAGWQKELQAYEKERTVLSAKELELKKEVLSNKQQQINAYQESMQKHMIEEEKKTTQTVINDINDYIKEYGKKNGYKIIFGASGTGNIMYADESSDLTEQVLKGLNEEYGKK